MITLIPFHSIICYIVKKITENEKHTSDCINNSGRFPWIKHDHDDVWYLNSPNRCNSNKNRREKHYLPRLILQQRKFNKEYSKIKRNWFTKGNKPKKEGDRALNSFTLAL